MVASAKDLIQRQASLETERSTFEQHWAEIAPFVLPIQDDFFTKNKTQGEKKPKRKKFDDTAVLALQHGAAAIESVVSPRGQRWHGISLPEQIADDQESMEWADRLTSFLFKQRYSATNNAGTPLFNCYKSLLAFGNCVLLMEDMLDGSIRYRSSHISEHFIEENLFGMVDTDYRKYQLTARQAREKFGAKTPESILKALEKNSVEKFEFLHVVMPDDEELTDQKFISYHVSIEDQEILGIGSFRTFPYIYSRWSTSPNEKYGRSPAMDILSEIRMLNAQRMTDIKARHLAVDPPNLAADQQTVRRVSLQPGAMNYGTLDINGNQLVRPYQSGVSIAASNDGLEQSREFINRAFFLNLFQILVDAPSMTATEVLQRAQEKGQLLTPTAGRQMSELLEPMIQRELSIYESYGLFEDGQPLALPNALKEVGGVFDIKYTNPLSRMQMSEEALGVERTLQSLLPIAQFDPSVLDRFDFMEYGNIMREANGAPARIYLSDEELALKQQAQQQQQQLQTIIESAPQVAGAVKDIAQAQNIQQ